MGIQPVSLLLAMCTVVNCCIAIDPDGNPNYTHDPKFLIKNPPTFHIAPEQATNLCKPAGEGVESFKTIDQSKEVVMPNIKKIRSNIESSSSSKRKNNKTDNVKLFCAVYTCHERHEISKAISETWGQRYDGILYASDISNYTTGHMHLPSNSRYGFDYSSMYQRVRMMMAYLYDNFLDEYDFFHFTGDDVFVIVENMKEFLASDKIREWDQTPGKVAMTGFWTHWGQLPPVGKFYLNGGPGYTLSRKALKAYVEGPLQTCDQIDYRDVAMEDIQFSKCLWMHNFTDENAFPDTRDEEGAHRYHSVNITQHSHPLPQAGLYLDRVIPQSLKYMEEEYGFPIVDGETYISKSSVTFHKHTPEAIRRMELLLYRDIESECANIG